ncbi:MAG: protein PhnA [Kiritimatiellia bacterium]|jgi:protein PhnA
MDHEETLQARSQSQCELCTTSNDLTVYEIPPASNGSAEHVIYLCATCRGQIEHPERMDVHHWRCLADSMWSDVPAVQIMAWRMLNQLKAEGWAQDLLDTLHLDEELQRWAEADAGTSAGPTVKHVDAHGAALEAGDTISLIKDLEVKGAGFTAKRGTSVRSISLVADNPEQIEGRINGQRIVILTQFVKKAK